MNFEISFEGMDREINDDLYRVHFPEYMHLYYKQEEHMRELIPGLRYESPLLMSWCGMFHYETYFLGRLKKGKLDPVMLTTFYDKVTCPTCIDRLVFSTLGNLP